MKKQLLGILMCLAMMLALFPAVAMAATPGDGTTSETACTTAAELAAAFNVEKTDSAEVDSNGNVKILKNFGYSGEQIMHTIYTAGNITIDLNGTFIVSGDTTEPILNVKSGKLTLVGSGTLRGAAKIVITGNVSIAGSGEVTLHSGTDYYGKRPCVPVTGNVTVTGKPTVHLYGSKALGGTLTAEGFTIKGDNDPLDPGITGDPTDVVTSNYSNYSRLTITPLDPDIATVTTAKNEAESTNYPNPTKVSDYADEAALASYVKGLAETAIDDSSISVNINKVSYTPQVDGTKETPNGTNGSYKFTVTVSKGVQTATTTEKSISIPAKPYKATEVTADNGKTPASPNTGDNSSLWIYLLIAAVSLGGTGTVLFRKNIQEK